MALTGTGLRATTRGGQGAHLWFRDGALVYGAWEGADGLWCHATAWCLDGRSAQGVDELDLVPAPDLTRLGTGRA